MAELAPSFCMPACCLYNARQPQTLRQNPPDVDGIPHSSATLAVALQFDAINRQTRLFLNLTNIGDEIQRRHVQTRISKEITLSLFNLDP